MITIGYEWSEDHKAFFISDGERNSLDYEKDIKDLKTKRGVPVLWRFSGSGEKGNHREYLSLRDIHRYSNYKGISISEVIIDVLDALLDKGFPITAYAQKQYDYYKGKAEENILAREQERERKKIAEELAKKQKEEEMQKAIANSSLKIPFCDKYGCKTSSQECVKCRYRPTGCTYRIVNKIQKDGKWCLVL